MDAMPPVLRAARGRDVRRWVASTPGRLALCLAAVVVTLLVAAGASLTASSRAGSTIRTIGTDAEPSVVLALQIGATLADMDAAAADDALGGGLSATGASQRWRDDKATLDALVVQAGRNITYAEETTALRGLLHWSGEYQASLAEVRDGADAANPMFAVRRLQWSHRLLTSFVQPEADALAAANRAPLEAAYALYRSLSAALGTLAVLAAALVCVVLAGVQVFLWRRTHRMVSPALGLALLVAAGLGVGLVVATLGEREDIRAAKADCYDSLDPLFAAKGAAAAMNGDLSYWLLDPGARDAQSAALLAHARAVLDVDVNDPATVAGVRARLLDAQRLETEGRPVEALAALPVMGGFLGREMANVTFGTRERDAASDAVRALLDLVAAAGRVRGLGGAEQRLDALRVREASYLPAVAALQGALDRTIAVNQEEFDRDVAHAQRTTGWTPGVVMGTLVLIGLLAAAGLWPRYREYM